MGYVIHHIDFNRENNQITNLVCIKKSDHSLYHMSKKIFDSLDHNSTTFYGIKMIEHYFRCCKILKEAIKERDLILGDYHER